MSKSLGTKIPTLTRNFRPKVVDHNKYKKELNASIQRYCDNYNRNAKKIVRLIEKGNKVRFKKAIGFRNQNHF